MRPKPLRLRAETNLEGFGSRVRRRRRWEREVVVVKGDVWVREMDGRRKVGGADVRCNALPKTLVRSVLEVQCIARLIERKVDGIVVQ